VLGGVVLAGGAGRRMGGADKAALTVGGVRLLDRVLAAARPVCDLLVVVGPARPTAIDGVVFVVEDQPGGGPVPAIATGLAAVDDCDTVLVLAADLPLLRTGHLQRLVLAVAGDLAVQAAAAADRSGPNPLLAAYRPAPLRARLAGLGRGSPAGALLPASTATVDVGPATLNVNRPADLAVAELLVTLDDAVMDVAHWTRELVFGTVPGVIESVDPGLGFDYCRRRPGGPRVCSILAGADGVTLASPAGGVRVRAPGDPGAEQLVALIEAAADRR
jgi:molybdopterin-guanine dinucleotide biosynthesis protein A